jgi:hypothetical protein
MERVFVSYSRHNLDVITQLIQDLKAVGIEAWHDETLTGGQRWWDNILSNIRDCRVFVFSLSPESLDSEACRSELSYATQLGRTILPVLVVDGVNINLLPPPLNEIQVTDYRGLDKEAAFALVKAINTSPVAAALPDPLPPAPAVPVSYLSNLKERIDTSAPLSSQEQIALLFELEAGLREGRSHAEIRDLLLRLKRRDDLLAKVATKVDAALKSLEDNPPIPKREHAAFGAKAPKPPAQEPRPGAYRPAAEPMAVYHPDPQPEAAPESRFCGQCGAQMAAGSRFCASCGASLPEQGPQQAPRAAKTRRYALAASEGPRLIADVKTWLDGQGFDSQQLPTETQGVLLQIKKRGGWRDFVGMSTSLNVVFYQAEDSLTVEIGAGKWIDKAAGGAVGMFLLWPLAFTAGFGAWQQIKMPDKIFEFIGSRLMYK